MSGRSSDVCFNLELAPNGSTSARFTGFTTSACILIVNQMEALKFYYVFRLCYEAHVPRTKFCLKLVSGLQIHYHFKYDTMFYFARRVCFGFTSDLFSGGIFNNENDDQSEAFKLGIKLANRNKSTFALEPVAHQVDSYDTLNVSRAACTLLESGIVGMIGPNSPTSSKFVQSLCDVMEMPQVETHWDSGQKRSNCHINVHPYPPSVERLFVDVIRAWSWEKFTVIYDDEDSLSKLNELLVFGNKDVQIKIRQLELDSVRSYRAFLNGLKLLEENRFVLICSLGVLEEYLKQAQQVGLMTQQHHYIIYNLDFHVLDLEQFQYSGCNITGVSYTRLW